MKTFFAFIGVSAVMVLLIHGLDIKVIPNPHRCDRAQWLDMRGGC